MKKYNKPFAEVVEFDNNDVIATSTILKSVLRSVKAITVADVLDQLTKGS